MDDRHQQTVEEEAEASISRFSITARNIFSIALAVVMRPVSIIIYCYSVYDYMKSCLYSYAAWTVLSILLSMGITSLLYLNILTAENVVSKPALEMDTFLELLFSYFFRDGKTLFWAVKCNKAIERRKQDDVIEYYSKYVKEECNVGLIRLLDCFLESAPQKILQLAIVFRDFASLTYYHSFTFCIYFGTIAWSLMSYNRLNRSAQLDKHDIKSRGLVAQFVFLLCFTVSRMLCIAFMARTNPTHTLYFCIFHSLVCGTIVSIVDAPRFSGSLTINYIFCVAFGVVYLYIFTSLKEGPTRNKYIFYLILCVLENIAICALYVPLYYGIFIVFLYAIGIIINILYYVYWHPRITA
ncbi:XK-related protein 4 [Scaptodrosophila lebanonensis]|uniref:XK-related protein n=1 Tax=Drosophila lebanonensis TaxID=7225 RepID=A0A6J2TXX3_DROLE|nr:XK-related protein 4 [Scaptodrosophila lebanonensis]